MAHQQSGGTPRLAQTESYRAPLDAFRQGLRENGWVEGQNVSIGYRFAEGDAKRLPALAAELVQLRPEVIVLKPRWPSRPSRMPHRPFRSSWPQASTRCQFVASMARPGGNITGMSLTSEELSGKRLQLLTEIIPRLPRVAVMTNPVNPAATLSLAQTRSAAQSLGVQILPIEVRLRTSRVHFLPSQRHAPML